MNTMRAMDENHYPTARFATGNGVSNKSGAAR